MATQWLGSKCSTATIALAIAAALSASTAISLYFWRRKCRGLESKIRELQKSLKSSSEKCGAERQGRIRAQQISVISSKLVRQSYAAALKTGHASGVQSEGNGESGLQITPQNQLVVMHNSLKEMETQLVEAMRKALAYPKSDNLELSSYPMAPIGVIQSCFSTRNGTPRQPLLVPLARACLVFDPTRVPPASLEGLGEYSHCWIIYVFHLNTDLEKLWKEPSKSKFKAKVRVPRLKGGRMGVFATRSPHRPCPIGLTVAKVEAVEENMVLLSGVDLVDGTPVVDVKPYLPYCDAIKGATVPKWVMEDNLLEVASVSFSEGFPSILADCWVRMGKKSLYASPEEFQSLIKQVLSWDIRSPSQRNRPYDSHVEIRNGKASVSDSDSHRDEEASTPTSDQPSLSFGGIIYHLNLEGLDVSYRINCDGDVIVEKVTISPDIPNSHRNRCNSSSWIDKSR